MPKGKREKKPAHYANYSKTGEGLYTTAGTCRGCHGSFAKHLQGCKRKEIVYCTHARECVWNATLFNPMFCCKIKKA